METPVVQICKGEKTFTFDEANDLLPIVKAIIGNLVKALKKNTDDHNWYVQTGASQDRIEQCNQTFYTLNQKAFNKLHKLGVRVIGDNYVGFWTGSYYLSYHYPEDKIQFWHGTVENPRYSRHRIEVLKILK